MSDYNRKDCKNKIPIHHGMKEAYQYYLDNYDNKYNINQTKYTKVFKDVMEDLMKLIIYENFDFRFPLKIGNLRVRKTKIKLELDEEGNVNTRSLRPDWYSTKELWATDEEARLNKTLIYHMNDHNDRYNMWFYYDKRTSDMLNQSAYKLLMSRKWKRELAKALKNKKLKIDYFE